jgi:inner membrane protein
MIPNQVNALWSIELSPGADSSDHVAYRTHRDANSARAELLWAMVSGADASGRETGLGGG